MSLRRALRDRLGELWPGVVEVPLRLAAAALAAVIQRVSRACGGAGTRAGGPARDR